MGVSIQKLARQALSDFHQADISAGVSSPGHRGFIIGELKNNEPVVAANANAL
jgi:hypothetical protein